MFPSIQTLHMEMAMSTWHFDVWNVEGRTCSCSCYHMKTNFLCNGCKDIMNESIDEASAHGPQNMEFPVGLPLSRVNEWAFFSFISTCFHPSFSFFHQCSTKPYTSWELFHHIQIQRKFFASPSLNTHTEPMSYLYIYILWVLNSLYTKVFFSLNAIKVSKKY